MSDERLCLLTVHAHPDDEASKGAGSVAKAHAEGIHTVLVCCTGGEAGDILNPAMDTDEVKADIGAVRQRELEESVRIIGYDELVMLGYRDSGMPDSDHNKDAESFHMAPMDEAVGRLVDVIRRTRPQVIVTYDEDNSRYPHPDHIKVHEISAAAFDAAGDPDAYPEAGEPWQPLKLYYSSFSARRFLAMHDRMIELGLESPMDAERMKAWREALDDERVTTSVDIEGFAHVRDEALKAHATQVDPNNKFWFGLPPEEGEKIHPYDEYILARSLIDAPTPEDDLFAGVRSPATKR
jgi:mycothiol S-conjugate amidase